MVILVVLLHAALAYCSFTKKWWIVVSDNSSVVAEIISGALDIYLMPVLFFVSGYFAIPSFAKCSIKNFIIKKMKGLYFPLIVGVILFNPFLVAMVHIQEVSSLDGFIEITLSYYRNFITLPVSVIQDRTLSPAFFSHYHLWYLSLLLYFFLIFVIVSKGFRLFRNPDANDTRIPRVTLYAQLLILVLLSSAGYALMYLIFGESWFVVSIVQLQLSRIIPYICFFVFGILSYRNRWVLDNNLISHPAAVLSAVIVLTPVCLYFSRILLGKGTISSILIYGLSRYALCVLCVVGLIGIFRKYFNQETPFNRMLNKTSFGLYFLHLNVVVLFLFIFTRLGAHGDLLVQNTPDNIINLIGAPVVQIILVFTLSLLVSTGLYMCYARMKRIVKRMRRL